MKKKYIFTTLICAFAFICNAQIIDDDFESYSLGPLFPVDHWTNWSQSSGASTVVENIVISSDFASSGTKSGFVGNGGAQDAILLLGNLTSGLYTLSFNMYVPSGSEGYFNIQGTIPATGILDGIFNSGNIYFNKDNTNSGVGIDEATGITFAFPHDTWFIVSIAFDLDAASHTYQMTINGTLANATPTDFQEDSTLGAIDFFSVSGNTTAYYDDIYFDLTSLSVDEFRKEEISFYPNPVSDVLHIDSKQVINSVTVYDLSGRKVLDLQPNAVSPVIDMSTLSTGAYIVQMTIGDATKTIKIIK